MEISKLNFDTVKTDEITKSFEDLDVNNDGVISDKDVKATKNSSLANVINNVLDNVDDDAEIVNATKTGANRNSYGVMETDAANFDKDVKNSKGTVYVIMGNLSGAIETYRKAVSIEPDNQEIKFIYVYFLIHENFSTSLLNIIKN